jgi:hypothetical protein
MKKISVVLGFFLFFVFSIAPAYCGDKSNIIDKNNKYGGKTEQEIYHSGDKKFENGISKIVEYYDGNNRIVQIESFYRDTSIIRDGVFKREQHYKKEPLENEKLTKAEFYYSDEHSRQDGITKSEIFYNDDEKKTKAEFYYTPEYAKKKILSKMDVFYDKEGDVIKRIYYDSSDKVISTEEKQLEGKTKK